MCVCVYGSLSRASSENILLELDFLKALSSQRWIGCKICKALWKIAGETEERVKERVGGKWKEGGRGLKAPGPQSLTHTQHTHTKSSDLWK